MKQLTHDIVEAEAEFLEKPAQPYISELKRLKKGAGRVIRGKKGLDILDALVYYFKAEGFSKGDSKTGFLCDLLSTKRGDCYPTSALYIILGNELDLPVSYAEAPAHVFIRWAGSENFETMRSATVENAYYTDPKNGFFSRLGMHPRSAETGAYMTTRPVSQILSVTFSQRGLAQLKRSKYELALADCKRSLEINPVKVTALSNSGLTNMSLERYEEARQQLERALDLDPHDADVHSTLGTVYGSLGDYKNSLDNYTISIDIDPNRPFPYFGRAYSNFKTGHPLRAAADVPRLFGKAAIEVLAKIGGR